MGVIFHGEYATFNRSLTTWRNHGLLRYVGEMIVYLNGVQDDVQAFEAKMGKFIRDPGMTMVDGVGEKGGKERGKEEWMKVVVVGGKENKRLGIVIGEMVEMSMFDEFLLMEKDWALVEDEGVLLGMLDGARKMVSRGETGVKRTMVEGVGVGEWGVGGCGGVF